MFLTDAQVQPSIAAALHKADWPTLVGAAAWWTQIVADAHVQAYNDIVTRLAARGYTLAQIQSWDRGGEFEKALTVFWALNNGGGLENLDDKFINKLDRRDELSGNETKGIEAIAITANSVALVPAQTGAVDLVTTGTQSGGRGFFNLDADDPRLGKETDW